VTEGGRNIKEKHAVTLSGAAVAVAAKRSNSSSALAVSAVQTDGGLMRRFRSAAQ